MKNKVKIDIIVGLIVFTVFFLIYMLYAPRIPEFYGEWERKTDSEIETLYLGKKGHFSYYTSEGNPVGDYDLCESYYYRRNEIKLQCLSLNNKEYPNKFKVVSYSDKKLVLKIGKEEVTFYKENK